MDRCRETGVDEGDAEAFSQPGDGLCPIDDQVSGQVELLADGFIPFEGQEETAGNVAHVAEMLLVGETVGAAAEKELVLAGPLGGEIVEHRLGARVTARHGFVLLVGGAEGEDFGEAGFVEELTWLEDGGEANGG